MGLFFSRRGQIWIETVVYTLIGLALIGLVLAILTPKIKEFRDRSIIEQSIDSLNVIDSKINEILDAPGNRRKIELTIDKGKFIINATGNSTIFELGEMSSAYSEPGLSVTIGRVNVTTTKLTEKYNVRLEIHYPIYNISFEGIEGEEYFTSASLPYKFFVTNNGTNPLTGVLQIDVTEG